MLNLKERVLELMANEEIPESPLADYCDEPNDGPHGLLDVVPCIRN